MVHRLKNLVVRVKMVFLSCGKFNRFVMASLNINSLLAHIDEFRVFMNESDIDIISINETKLHSSNLNYKIHNDLIKLSPIRVFKCRNY